MSLTLVIPAYNEAKRIGSFLESISHYHANHPNQITQILVVDDGSTDQTSSIVEQANTRLPLKVISHPTNRGKGAAVKTGVDSATTDIVVFIDADGATPISELPKMLTALTKADIAIGNRWLPGAQTDRHSNLRILSGWTYRNYMKLFGLGKIDTMCGFKGYRTEIAGKLFQNLQEERWLFDTEIAYKAVQNDYSIINFPIHWTSQDGSKLDTATLLKSALQIWPLIQKLKKNS